MLFTPSPLPVVRSIGLMQSLAWLAMGWHAYRDLVDASSLPPRESGQGSPALGGCRTWSVDSENRRFRQNGPQRGQFLPDLQPHSPAMGQKDGKKWTAAADLQPTISKSDSLLGGRP